MPKINVAVVGVGAMGKSHARVYSDIDNVNLVAVCDSNAESAKQIGNKYHANIYADYKEMIRKEKIDAVSICVPTKWHKDVAVYFLRNKINVLVEKPIATTLDEAKEMIDESTKNNTKLMVGILKGLIRLL